MKTEKPLVSICTLVYNHEPYLRECFDGFIMQKTNFAFEVLVHDDASTDGSADIIREYTAKYPEIFKPIYQQENQYSKGIRVCATYQFPRAKGEYIAMCEGDDYWIDPMKLQNQVDFMEENLAVDLVWTRAKCYSQSKKRFLYDFGESALDFDELLQKNTIPTLTVAFRKKSIDGFLAVTEGKMWKMGDYPLWLYIALNGRIHFMDEVTAVYRYLDESASHFKSYESAKQFLENTHLIRLFYLEYSKKVDEDLLVDNHNYNRFCLAFRYREYKESITYYKKIKNRKLTKKDKLKFVISRIYLALRLHN